MGPGFALIGAGIFSIVIALLLAVQLSQNIAGITVWDELFSTNLTGLLFGLGVVQMLLGGAILYYGNTKRGIEWVE